MAGRITVLVSMLGLSGACYVGSDAPADTELRNIELNGPVLNGPILQGPILQGPILQGVILNGPILQGPILQGPILQGPILQGPILQGVVLNGPILQGPILQGPILQGTEFQGVVIKDGQEVPANGEDFEGSEWDLRVGQIDEEGNELVEEYTLRFDAIYPSDEFDDVLMYEISHRPKAGGTWMPLCPDGTPEGAPAIPLHNYWNLENGDRIDDENVITFACKNAVLAKCVLYGYRPWATGSKCKNADKGKHKKCEDVPLTEYHQACTRMARADYCGDGTAWTVEGTAIDVKDLLYPPVQEPTTDWAIEAEWNPDGAYCLNDLRNPELRAQQAWPQCFLNDKGKKIKKNNCGALKNERALMYSTYLDPQS